MAKYRNTFKCLTWLLSQILISEYLIIRVVENLLNLFFPKFGRSKTYSQQIGRGFMSDIFFWKILTIFNNLFFYFFS